MSTRFVFQPRIILLLLMPLLLAACARAAKGIPTQGGAPTVLQGDFRVHDPSIIKQDDAYYVFSTGFDLCCRSVISTYNIRVGRSATITGPYIDRDGVGMDRGGGTLLLETKDRFVGPGGQTIYLDNGVYRMVNHYYDRADQGTPKLQIHDLGWTSDGWPIVEQQ